jgi:formylglycine-generating enzyme required for sulfatase activity
MRCNSKEGRHGNTTPVAAYPVGASPYGLLDMVGNVWEWTRSVWGTYPYPTGLREKAQRENLKAARNKSRVRRGEASDDFHRLVRCAYRDRGHPNLSDKGIDFRVVVRPAS